MRALLAAALLAMLAAGCVRPDDAPEPPTQAEASLAMPAAPTTGALVVRALMPDRAPLPGVEVLVANATATTDADGVARLADLPAGRHALEARKEAHRTAQSEVDITAGATREVEVVLAALGEDQHAHEKGLFAHRDLYVFEGHFDCSATYVIITGDCLVVVDAATNATGQSAPDATTERNVIDFPLDATWRTLVVEMTWTPGAATPATGGQMTLALEPADGHAAKYARAAGGSPLAVRLESGVRHGTATAQDMPNPDGGEVIRARAYVAGLAHNAGDAGYLGAGAAAKHEFRILVSIFYEEPAPEGYSALAEAS